MGAGLVSDAALPLSIELVSRLKAYLLDASSDDAGDAEERALARLHLATLRFLDGGIRFQEGVLDRDPDCPVNVEQIAAAALELRERKQNLLAPYTSGWHQRVIELETGRPDLLKSFVDVIYSKLNRWLTFARIEDIAYLARIADFTGDSTGIDIFSLNYDLCIETALIRIAERDFVNGFTEEGWRGEVLRDEVPIRLFKLHGSLDWVDDEAYGVCALECPRHKDAEDIEPGAPPLLIFGTSRKLSAREPFLSLAYHFSQAVLKAKLLVIIGYSFGDAYVNEIVEQGLKTNTRIKLLIVSPGAEKRISARPLLHKNPRVEALSVGAKEALNNGAVLRRVRGILREAAKEEPF